jgi:Cys-tRNA(Pro) deacylase
MMLSPSDLQAFLQTHVIQGEILHLEMPTPTVEAAARAVGAQNEQIVKTLLFLIHDQPVAAIANGTAHIDRRSIAACYQVGRKQVKLAPPETVLAVTGYPAGAVPPFGHREPLPTLLDPRVLTHAEVYAGGGAGNALVRLNPIDILKITDGQVIDLLSPP